MAISKILNIKACDRSTSLHLRQGIDYITKDEKTSDGLYVGAVNCSVTNSFDDMMSTKKIYGKTDKRQAYHLIISFEEGECDAETAYEVVKEFAERYLSSDYEAVYSVHNDTDHIHGHIIWNSVRFTDGYKYRYEKGDWEKTIQPLVNEICKKHGLSVLDPAKEADKEKEWDVSKNGSFVWNDQIKRDVDECIIRATDFEMFIQMLEEKNYEVKRGKHLAVKPQGMQRFRRLKTLGDEYLESNIRQRIEKESITHYRRNGITSTPKIKSFKGTIKRKPLRGLKKRYFALLYRLGKIKKRSYSNYYKYRDDIRKLRTLQKQYLFISRYDIMSAKDITETQENIKTQISITTKARKALKDANKNYEEVFEAVRTIKKEKQAATFYKLGDATFHRQNEAVSKARDVLKKAELSYKEACKLEEHYTSLISECDEKIKKLKGDMRISYGLIKDIQYRRDLERRHSENSLNLRIQNNNSLKGRSEEDDSRNVRKDNEKTKT